MGYYEEIQELALSRLHEAANPNGEETRAHSIAIQTATRVGAFATIALVVVAAAQLLLNQ